MTNFPAAIEKVHEFYSAAFGQLVTYTTALLAFVGVILPLAISLQQARQAKREKHDLERGLKVAVAEAKSELLTEIRNEFETEKIQLQKLHQDLEKALREEIDKMDTMAVARSLHLQAHSMKTQGLYRSAADNIAAAARNYLKSEDETNFRRAVNFLIDCLKELDSDDFLEDAFPRVEEQIDKLITTMEEASRPQSYTDEKTKVRRSLHRAKNRVAAEEAEGDFDD